MRGKTAVLIMFILIILLLVGCGSKDTDMRKPVARKPAPESPEDTLLKEISGGKLVEVYDGYVELKPGESKENWMIISNVRDETETFTIYPCKGCAFSEDSVEIPAGGHKVIGFEVSSDEDLQEVIRVKDSQNNAYGYASIGIIVKE